MATLAGALLIPTLQRLLSKWVEIIGRGEGVRFFFRRAISPALRFHLREAIVLPRWENIARLRSGRQMPWTVPLLNIVATAVWSVGVFAALYAGCLRPEIRVTASQLSAVVNGIATILMFAFIDP